ncbi:PAS domain-containing protein [Nonomuraea thailandensis]|uniref:PAS domain-containing protein n=1 Tax=Nonomuraea thailandensis TaxID=1188745 RepID=UPI003558C5CF
MAFVAVNRAHERLFGRTSEECVGHVCFEVFPSESWPEGRQALRASLERVLASGDCASDLLLLQRYDVEVPGRAGEFAERYWSAAQLPAAGSRRHGLRPDRAAAGGHLVRGVDATGRPVGVLRGRAERDRRGRGPAVRADRGAAGGQPAAAQRRGQAAADGRGAA